MLVLIPPRAFLFQDNAYFFFSAAEHETKFVAFCYNKDATDIARATIVTKFDCMEDLASGTVDVDYSSAGFIIGESAKLQVNDQFGQIYLWDSKKTEKYKMKMKTAFYITKILIHGDKKPHWIFRVVCTGILDE